MNTSLRENYQNFKIFFTFLLFWFSIQFGTIIEDVVAYFLVATIGILHGANDLLIISKAKNTRKIFLKNLIVYIGIILCCVFLFFVIPKISIVLFVVISSYHFGEEHLDSCIDINFIFNSFYFLFYGLLIFSMIFFNSLEDVNIILTQIIENEISSQYTLSLLYFSVLGFFLLNLYLFITKRISKKIVIKEVFYLLLLFLVFKTSSLIFGFAVYFIFWHSLPSLIDQIKILHGTVNVRSVKYYIKSSILCWILAIMGLIFSIYFLNNNDGIHKK